MPYIAFDLDALSSIPAVAGAAGLPEGSVALGCLRMWAHCWKAKTDRVQPVQLAGFFGSGEDRVRAALSAFGFLEEASDGLRVKGAERYLRVSKARAEAGRARAGASRTNAGRFTSKSPAIAGQPASKSPATDQLLHRASSINLSLPSEEMQQPTAAAPPAQKPITEKPPPDPRHTPLVRALCAAFEQVRRDKYAFGKGRQAAANAVAVSDLLGLGEPAEVERRWRRALANPNFPTVSTFAELRQHWNHFAGAGSPTRENRGAATAKDTDWSDGKGFLEGLGGV